MAFFFINKTATSARLTRSETDEASAIQHFVQKGRKRARKVKLINCSNAHTFATPTVVRVERHGADDASKDSDNENLEDGAEDVTEDANGDVNNDIHVVEDNSAITVSGRQSSLIKWKRDSELLSLASRAPSPISHCVNANIDPFQASSITIDATARSLILYYTNIYHPAVWPNEASALRYGRTVFETEVNHVIQESIKDSLSMYCLLTASLCRARYIDKVRIVGAPNKENLYMSEALRHMQSRIDGAASKPGTNLLYLLGPIIFLSAAEGYRDNRRASQVHLKACSDLLAYHGMTVADVEDPNVQGQLQMSDLFLSCTELHSCLFNSDLYDPGPLSVLNLQSNELNEPPNELATLGLSLLKESAVSQEVREMVARVKEIYTIKRSLNTASMTSTRALETAHWVTKRAMAVRNILLSSFPPAPRNRNDAKTARSFSFDTPEENLDKAVRVALIQFTLLSMNITGRIKTVKIMAVHLQRLMTPLVALFHCDDSRGQLYLIFWLLLIGYSCAQDDSETEKWFGEQCLTLIDLVLPPPLDEEDTDDLEARLELLRYSQRNFFYHKPVQELRLRKLLEQKGPEDLDSPDSTVVIAPYTTSPEYKTLSLFDSYKYRLVS